MIASSIAIPWWVDRQPPWTATDAWYKAPPPDFSWEAPRIYAGIYEVRDSQVAEAERRLARESVVELKQEDVRELLGRDVLPLPGFKPYLIRGVNLGRRGQDSIALSGNAAVVIHETPGTVPSAMRKRPLVAFLPRRPQEVYVTLSTFH
jgi:hypothetical protein